MLPTNFFSPSVVRCSSFPRLRLRAESSDFSDARGISCGFEDGGQAVSFDLSETADSTLAESPGISFEPGREPFMSIAGVIAN